MVDPTLEMWRLPVVKKRTGLGHDTIYKLIKDGTFPRPYSLSANTVGWRSDEVLNWMVTREPTAVRGVAA